MMLTKDHVFFVGDGLCILTIEIDNLGTSSFQGLDLGANKKSF